MKREILFRGKRIDNGEWAEGFLMANFDNNYSVQTKCDFDGMEYFMTYKVDPNTAMQFTGLTDKNGVKIFEGDIVNVTGGLSGDYTAKERVSIVEYDENEFYAACNKDGNWWNGCEVIGNIHDNKDILK